MTQHTWLNDPYLALGAQVRLRRNVDGLPFGPRLQEAQALGLLHRAEDASKRASGAEMVLVPLQDLSPDCRQALVAQGLISRDMEGKKPLRPDLGPGQRAGAFGQWGGAPDHPGPGKSP